MHGSKSGFKAQPETSTLVTKNALCPCLLNKLNISYVNDRTENTVLFVLITNPILENLS